MEQFLFYRRSEVDHYQNSSGQEQFCFDTKHRLDNPNVLLMEYVCNGRHLREEIPVVAVNLSKGIDRCETGSEDQSPGDGLE